MYVNYEIKKQVKKRFFIQNLIGLESEAENPEASN
jgi:hypothetical protein